MAPYTGTRLFFLAIGRYTPPFDTPHGAVLSCKPDGSDLQTLVSGLGTHPDGIAVDTENSHIYYTNMGVDSSAMDGFISRCDLDGKNNTAIVKQGVTFTPKQMTIEPRSKKIYWCDREGMKIWRANMDGSLPEVLYQAAEGETARKDERNHCVGIALNIDRGCMMWTQKGPSKGGQGRLFTAGIDIPRGETPENRSDIKLLLDGLPEPIDLDFDPSSQIIYKTDRGAEPRGNTVSKVHLDQGVAVEEILDNHLHEAIGLALDLKTGKMYFTDLGGSVYTANLDGSNKRELLKNVGDFTGICCVHFD